MPSTTVALPTPKEQQQLKRRKTKQKRFSEASAILGGAALATKVPSYAAAGARRFPTARGLHRIGNLAPKADAISGHIVPVSLGIGALGSVNFARLQGQEAKQQPVLVRKDHFLRTHRDRISPGAEDAYRDLGQRKRRRYSDAAAHGVIGGTAGLTAGGWSKLVNTVVKPGRGKMIAHGVLTAPFATVAGVEGYNAVRRAQEGRSLQQRRNKIKAKAYERQAQGVYGRPLKDIRKAFGMPTPRAGGLVRTTAGKVVTRRGALPGTVPGRLPGVLAPLKALTPKKPVPPKSPLAPRSAPWT